MYEQASQRQAEEQRLESDHVETRETLQLINLFLLEFEKIIILVFFRSQK